MNNKPKIIFHIDLNAFYASVEMILDPHLKNRVFAVGGKGSYFRDGILTTASYKARKYGIKSGMSINEALNRYPRLIIVPNNFPAYHKYSNIFYNYLKQYSNQIYKASIDEVYMDVTEISKEIHPLELAKKIQTELNEIHGLPVSIGIGPTLFLAKMGSDYRKPLGITVMRKRDVPKKLFPKSIGSVFGIGVKTKERLNDIDIITIADFANLENKNKIIEAVGENIYYSTICDLNGDSTDFVDVNKHLIPQSISNETTLAHDIDILEVLKERLDELFEETYGRLVKEDLICKSVFIKIRYYNFKTTTKTVSLSDYNNDYDQLKFIANELLENHYNGTPVRLIGVGFSNIIRKADYKEDRTLFNYEELDKKRAWGS